MHIRKAQLSKDVLDMINHYRNKKLDDIRKIKPRWAWGEYKKYSIFPVSKSEGYSIFNIQLSDLIKLADFGEMMYKNLNPQKLFTGTYERDFRIVKILNHWDKKGYIDPPEIGINHLQKITFSDGRHRTITAFHLGEKEIPVIVHKSSLDAVCSILKLDKNIV